ncbi:hypothetical protein [Gordonia polyisoprenivorans]|uniref:hypothetical protein n=1 Tax=Gordonia polyisoprenivorans TaxID=84595 RepID=UPI0030D3D653
MDRHRVLTILVDRIAIEDGQIRPPVIGEVIEFPLRFWEYSTSETGTDQHDAMTIRARLEPSGRPPRRFGLADDSEATDHAGRQDLWWSGLLRGDGWTASWDGQRPRTGQVELTGTFHGVMGIDAAGSVRGRVTRVQVVSHSWQLVPPPRRWSLTPGRRPTYREVDRAPRFFTDDRFDADCPSPTDVDAGALIDIDLDDVGPYPLRPPAVIAEVSAAGDDLWALDAVLPLVFRIDSERRASEYLFPGPVRYGRSVWATPTGCWIGGPDGTHRLTPGEPARTVDDTPVVAGAVVGEHYLACGGAGRWSILGPGGESRSVEGPTAVVTAAIADGDTFVVLLHSPSPHTDGVVLVRVGLDGAMHVGDPVILDDHHDRPSLLTSPLGIACYDRFVTLAPTLEATDTQHVPRQFFDAGTVGDGLWTLGHPPDGTARSGWWPLPGPTEYDHGRGRFWLLTVLDRDGLTPILSAPVLSSTVSVTRTDDGTLWVAAGGVLQILRPGTMQWPEPVDLGLR